MDLLGILFDDERGVSPVVGVVLIVAISIIIVVKLLVILLIVLYLGGDFPLVTWLFNLFVV